MWAIRLDREEPAKLLIQHHRIQAAIRNNNGLNAFHIASEYYEHKPNEILPLLEAALPERSKKFCLQDIVEYDLREAKAQDKLMENRKRIEEMYALERDRQNIRDVFEYLAFISDQGNVQYLRPNNVFADEWTNLISSYRLSRAQDRAESSGIAPSNSSFAQREIQARNAQGGHYCPII
ncbi:hypothetical protein EF513_07525 [Rickettsiales endosymbiont of Stachyamoeba lipophora]|nr:hypothetical protein [Rickettsiales endosymbiont of Stachyamoeba lipophora]AZL16372.1 hypothetical protein EF513_07525 [Rickettsiales endosymbiont of Stachyamoeba lipophora]